MTSRLISDQLSHFKRFFPIKWCNFATADLYHDSPCQADAKTEDRSKPEKECVFKKNQLPGRSSNPLIAAFKDSDPSWGSYPIMPAGTPFSAEQTCSPLSGK